MKSIHKRSTIIHVAFFLFCIGNLKLCAQQSQEDRKVSSFENIVIETSANTYVYVSYDNTPRVTVKADQRVIDKIKTSVSDGTLTIHFNSKQFDDIKAVVYVQVPIIKKVSISGGGNVEIIDGFDSNILQTHIMGSGSMLFKKEADVVMINEQ